MFQNKKIRKIESLKKKIMALLSYKNQIFRIMKVLFL